MQRPIHVTISGAAGAIGYALVFRVASGQMFGPDQPVVLRLLELPQALDRLKGVAMEINDCAFPLLDDIVTTSDPVEAFDGSNLGCLVGGRPRQAGMERSDLIRVNAGVFKQMGEAIQQSAADDFRAVVVANPCNTNALITAQFAPKVPRKNITAMTRLDQNRAVSQLAAKAGVATKAISEMAIWGNHSPTMFPDFYNAKIEGKAAIETVDEAFLKENFVSRVAKRGAEIIKVRGSSSAASAANAVIDHVYDWYNPSPGKIVSMVIESDGSYGFDKGLMVSYPVQVDEDGTPKIVQGIELNPYAQDKLAASNDELAKEREIVAKELDF